jgi:hypothetical protein
MELEFNTAALLLMLAFTAKHLLVEGPLQENWIFAGKGKFLGLGGLVHVVEHGALTLIILCLANIWLSLSIQFILCLTLAEVVLHYFIDYTKAKTTKPWTEFVPEINQVTVNSRWFWSALIIDQALHHLTYVGMVAIIAHYY